jgi:hypothetical protein
MTSRKRRWLRERGVMLMEVAAAVGLLMFAILLAGGLMRLTLREQRASEQRRLAVMSLDNAMERWASKDWEELTPCDRREVAVPEEIGCQLREPRLTLEIREIEPLRRLELVLSWKLSGGGGATDARLVSYVGNARAGRRDGEQ